MKLKISIIYFLFIITKGNAQFQVNGNSSASQLVNNVDFEDETFIKVIVLGGYGTYEYQLNNGPFQSSNRFENLASGFYKVTIKDTKGGCNSVVLEATIINYPKFFTPNGDDINDYWKIIDLYSFKDSKIHIFDRHSKFI